MIRRSVRPSPCTGTVGHECEAYQQEDCDERSQNGQRRDGSSVAMSPAPPSLWVRKEAGCFHACVVASYPIPNTNFDSFHPPRLGALSPRPRLRPSPKHKDSAWTQKDASAHANLQLRDLKRRHKGTGLTNALPHVDKVSAVSY